jgi:dynein heavy chain 2
MRDMGGKQHITWEKPIESEEYTKIIKEMAKELINENRKLKKVHNDVIKEVNQLQNIDLLKNEAAWKDKANTIKLMVE